MPARRFSTTSLEDIQDLLVRIAWLYYKENLSQKEIAKELGISRIKVVRFLKKARSSGIVVFHVWGTKNNCLSLEQHLKKRFGLIDAMVVPTARLSPDIRVSLGKAGAQFLYKNLYNGAVIGIAWGRTVYELISNFSGKEVKDVKIVNLMGGLTSSMSLNPYDIGGKLASLVNGQCYYLYAPAVTGSEEACNLYKKESSVRDTLKMALKTNISFVGVGEVSEDWTMVQLGYISLRELKLFKRKGAVGSILGQFFDKDGNKIEYDINKRLIAVPLEELKKLPNVVAVAGGISKAEAILGGIRGKYIKILITDENTAKKILELDSQRK